MAEEKKGEKRSKAWDWKERENGGLCFLPVNGLAALVTIMLSHSPTVAYFDQEQF